MAANEDNRQSLPAGFAHPASVARTTVSRQSSEVGARFGSAARRDLCGAVSSRPYRDRPTSRHDRYLRPPDGWSRRFADVAGRGLGRLNWARKRTYTGRHRRRGLRPKQALIEASAERRERGKWTLGATPAARVAANLRVSLILPAHHPCACPHGCVRDT
jgi:hypothetical protein